MPRAVTVWAVELGKGVEPEEIKGTLELATEALLFTPVDETRSPLRVPVSEIGKVRRLRGSPVLMVERATSSGSHRTAFYFVQPPPLGAIVGTTVERPSGLAAFRNPRRQARRNNVGYLGTMNREKKAVLGEWVRAIRAAARGGRSGPDQAAKG